jgi:hypothetical protein
MAEASRNLALFGLFIEIPPLCGTAGEARSGPKWRTTAHVARPVRGVNTEFRFRSGNENGRVWAFFTQEVAFLQRSR